MATTVTTAMPMSVTFRTKVVARLVESLRVMLALTGEGNEDDDYVDISSDAGGDGDGVHVNGVNGGTAMKVTMGTTTRLSQY